MTTMLDKITVFLVSENRLLREALARILNNKSDIAVVGSAAHSTAVVEKIAAISPQVLLFDSLPDLRCELSLVPALHKAVPNLKVVMIGMEPDREVFLWAVRGGIAGYMLKDATAALSAGAVPGLVRLCGRAAPRGPQFSDHTTSGINAPRATTRGNDWPRFHQ